MNLTRGFLIFLALALLGGCATMPTGPTVSVLPGPGKPFEVFQADDYACRQWAQQQIGGASPSQTANQNLATGAVVGTLVGAGLGAADRRCHGQRGRRRCNRCGGRPPRRNRCRERSCRFFRVSAPEALRHGLSAMHVCEGKPDTRCPAGASLWASTTRLWATTA